MRYNYKNPILLFTYLLIIWGGYRFLAPFPEEVEEFIIKPVLWLGPVFYLVFIREKKNLASIGVTLKDLFPSIYFALGLGMLFVLEGVFLNFVKYGNFDFAANIGQKPLVYAFAISAATAISEELTFRGYILTRLESLFKNKWATITATSICWTLIHLPISIFVWHLTLIPMVSFLFLTFLFGMAAGMIFHRNKNIIAPILLHLLWQWPIILFR